MQHDTDKNRELNFTFRVDAELKDAFVQAAKANDRSASLLLREFMREYIERDKAAALRKARES